MTRMPPPAEPIIEPIPTATSMITVVAVPHPVQSTTAKPVVLMADTAMKPASPQPTPRCRAIAAVATASSTTNALSSWERQRGRSRPRAIHQITKIPAPARNIPAAATAWVAPP